MLARVARPLLHLPLMRAFCRIYTLSCKCSGIAYCKAACAKSGYKESRIFLSDF